MVLSNSEKPLMEKLNLTVDQLDYKYIENCKNVKQLERVLRVLRSGEEGIYPHLIKFCEEKLKELDPNNKYLQLPKRIVNYSDLPEAERKSIISDLEVWSKNYSDEISKNVSETKIPDIPPVRRMDDSSKQVKNEEKKESQNNQEANRRVCKPRSYDEWNKFNVEEELEKINDASKDKTETDESKEAIEINRFIPTIGLTLDERERIADLERIKGNEAFKAQDYEEAVLYYTRSISALKTAKTLNNRAQTYLKLKNYFAAVVDCNEVISLEPSNVKALFRRGISHKEAEMYDLAIIDFEILLKLEPENKSAQDQLKQIENMKLQKMQARKKVVIKEIDSESSYDVEENNNVPDLNNKEISMRLTIEETTEDSRPTLDEICNCERNDDGIQPLSAKTKEMLHIFRDPSALANNSKNCLVSTVETNSQKKTSHKNVERNTSLVLGELSEQTESKKDFKEIEIQDKNPEEPKIKNNHFERSQKEFSKNTILEFELKTYLESNLECENKHVDGNINKDLNKSINKALSVTEEIKKRTSTERKRNSAKKSKRIQ
ncbi:sperm-associated antigen 1 [Trichonephila clavata]|uniref:Sperm-associated antigen 1 n=1 Tax=Trichonephila clavata TaxID=2740835 RepID=A0A8X6FF96_TRICU|nr:sperm-associated antigen 1 [Trichonephila clavata]